MAYCISIFAVKYTAVTIVSAYGTLMPALVVGMSVLFLGTTVDWHEGRCDP